MKNILGSCLGLVCLFNVGCGESFVPGFGSSLTGTTSIGGSDAGTTSTSNDLTTNSTTSTKIPVKYSLTSCEKDFVFTPWENYNLNNSPVINCVSVSPDKSSMTVSSFEYVLFEGLAPEPQPLCSINPHQAVWLKISIQNEDYSLPKDLTLQESDVNLDGIEWVDWKTDQYDGKVGIVKVDMIESVTITGSEVFCFGHRVSQDVSFNPTCDVGCLTNGDDYKQHQLSDSDVSPFNFNTLNSWPSDGDATKTVSLISAVYATE